MASNLVSMSVFQILIIIGTFVGNSSSSCDFPAIYNFGDSNSATGSRSGYGRLIIDFICEQLQLGNLNQYVNSNGADFSHGANFAAGGASIRPPGYSAMNLAVQVSLFQQFKAHMSNPPGHYAKSLYTVDIGQNDLAYCYSYTSEDQVRALIPDILDKFSGAIQTLYSEGARIFWIHITGPFGCLPTNAQNKNGILDQAGCVKSKNDMAQYFNSQLKDRLNWLKTKLTGSVFTYVDLYSAKYALISDAKNQGFADAMEFCGASCSNKSPHISWDGIHYSEAANQWVAKRIIFESINISEPSLPTCLITKLLVSSFYVTNVT